MRLGMPKATDDSLGNREGTIPLPITAITPAISAAHVSAFVDFMSDLKGAIPFSTSLAWSKSFPASPGVYVVFKGSQPIYVGETGELRGRMRDLKDTRNHTLRRSLGKELGDGGTASSKFPREIEDQLDSLMTQTLLIKCAPVLLGRKEIEEALIKKLSPKYNRKGQRGQTGDSLCE